ncbi:MAG: LLM class F420-dependent oxidoreductase [Segniliparus sp.]|uniref:LLM class F420-dependent oxidoreductase n=1 Tax=Segniliparus sp. TaxID=2804064 RepID=UPI003F345F1D
MDFRVFVEPQQGADYDDLLRVAKAAEDFGYNAFFRSDHYLAMNKEGLPGPTDAWITLAGLARETSRIRLGTLVTSATFRHPGALAVTVAQVDQMSGGRVEFGLGAGWYAEEHAAYGVPFPETKERFDRFAEQLEAITGLWKTPVGERFEHRGEHYTFVDSPALPKPAQSPHPPIVIGGTGAKRTPQLAARHACEFNVPFASADQTRVQIGRVRAACEAIGRDPASMVFSNAFVICVGRDEAEVARRAAAIGREVEELRANSPLAGVVDEVVDKLGKVAELGSDRFYLQTLDLADLDHLALVAERVVPQLG